MFSSSLLQRIADMESACHARFGTVKDFQNIGSITAVSIGAPVGDPVSTNTGWLSGAGALKATELADFERFCAAHYQTPTINMLSHQIPQVLPLLTARGYQLDYILHLYVHDLKSIPEFDLSSVYEAKDPEYWAELAALGFGPGSEVNMRHVAYTRGTRLFIAQVAGEDAASGAFALQDGLAAMHGGATRPGLRGRGAQAAVLAYRLQQAAEAGADLATVFVTPGSTSERNMERGGFQLAGMRLSFTQVRKPAQHQVDLGKS